MPPRRVAAQLQARRPPTWPRGAAAVSPGQPSAPAAVRMSPTAQWTEFSRLSVRIQYNTRTQQLMDSELMRLLKS
eukprot:COSAG02_NODE_25694_length_651_cov_2.217391_1_plen_74_part_10